MSRSIFCFLFICSLACNNSQRVSTPAAFINKVIVKDSLYKKDSIAILADLYTKLKSHTESFANDEYFDSTVVIVDSVLYDPTLNKIAVFVVAKNPKYRNQHSDSKLPFYYNANCYLGKRCRKDSSLFELKCLGPFNEINFDDKFTVVDALKSDYFFELTKVLDENRKPFFQYNLDDKRFWASPTGWERVFN